MERKGEGVQYCPKVSCHLASRFSRDRSRFSRDVSCFSRDISRFSRESLKHLVWHILRVRNQLFVKIVALQFNGKSMGPSQGRYMYALIMRSIHIEQTWNVISDKYKALNLRRLKNTIVFNNNLQRKGNSS